MAFNMSDELPSYMYAADVHNVANGQPSMIPDATSDSQDSTLDNLTKGSLSVIARAVTSTVNILPAATNWAGLTDMPEWKTEDLLGQFDDDLSAYYSRHRDSIDVIGDVASSFIPGMAGVKAMNYAQLGLKSLSRGNAGKNILQSIGALPDATSKFAMAARVKMAETGNTFSMIESNALKSFGTAYAQNALEFAAFETAAATAMGDRSPLFKDHTALDIVYNAALGGGVVGAGVLGTVSAVKTYGALKQARDVVTQLFNPARHVAGEVEGTADFVQLLSKKAQLDNPPTFDAAKVGSLPAGTDVTKTEQAWARTLEKRQRDLGLEIQTIATKMAGGDADVGRVLADSLKGLEQDQAWAATLHMKEVGRAGTPLAAEAVAKAAEDARFMLADTTGMSASEIARHTKAAASDELNSVKYLTVAGENAGNVSHTPPAALGLADFYGASTIGAQISKLVGKNTLPSVSWTPIGKSVQEVDAMYIHMADRKMVAGELISGEHLPALEAAYNQGIQRVVVDGIELDSTQLLRHIKETKRDMLGREFADALITPNASTLDIARRLNVSEKLVEGGHKGDGSELFRVKDGAELRKPEVIKIAYNGDPATVGVSGDVLSGMATLKQLQQVAVQTNNAAVASVFGGEVVGMMPKIMDGEVLGATSAGAGAGLMSFAAGGYNTLASKVEWIGKLTNKLKTEFQKATSDTLQPVMHKVLQNPDASTEIANIRHKILSTGEKYVLADGQLVRKSVAEYDTAMEASKLSGKKFRGAEPEPIPGVDDYIPLKTAEAREFLETWVKHNDEFIGNQRTLNSAIGKGYEPKEGEVYFPQPDSRKFPFFSMVVPKNPELKERVQMLWGESAEHLANLESKVSLDYTILRKTDTELYHKAIKDYDYDLGFHAGQILEDMKRTGVAAPVFPKTDTQTLMQEMLEWRHRASDKQVRDGVTLHNQVAFSELRRMDADYTALQLSTKKAGAVADSPFSSYVTTALDIPRSAHVPVWTAFNNLAENVYTTVHHAIADTVSRLKGDDQIAGINAHLEDAGIRGFKDAATELFANHPARGKELSKLVQTMNGAFSTLILRTDPMNAVNNGLGSLVITGAELSGLIKGIKSVGGDFEAELMHKAFVGVPGSQTAALSPIKLIGNAYADWFKLVGDSKGLTSQPELVAMKKRFGEAGFLPSMMDQHKSILDLGTLSGMETAGELAGKSKQMMSQLGDLLEKVTLNKSIEEMNRFVSAHIADSVSGIAVRAGTMNPADQYAFINTFVNRTQGNYLASQRPLMFQGPVGSAISLFQTYSFNMMQHVFRRVESGDKKQLAVLLGLQTGLYGFNGLPAFDFLNKQLVGMAAGNRNYQDIPSTFGGMTDTGADVGNWLLYGGLSNATGLGLYSRGDLNPRHLTILPSSLGDVPFISATRTALGSMVNAGSEMLAGADIGSTFLRGIEHAGLSRPLAGLATTMQGIGTDTGQGFTTTGKNGVIQAYDMYSLQTLGRIAGSRPLDEALARDAYHRVQVYDSHRQAEVAVVGSAIRDKVRGGYELTEGDVGGFLQEYVHKGGDQKTFIKFMQSQVKKANVSQVNQMTAHLNKPNAQYMQTFLHGAQVSDLANGAE